MERILIEQIEKNFNSKEVKILIKNYNLIRKIYLLGLINGKEIYE